MSTKLSTDLNWSRSSTRLHAPPGGHSSINIFGGNPEPVHERKYFPPKAICPPLNLGKLRVPEHAAGVKATLRPEEVNRTPLLDGTMPSNVNLNSWESRNPSRGQLYNPSKFQQTSRFKMVPNMHHDLEPRLAESQYQNSQQQEQKHYHQICQRMDQECKGHQSTLLPPQSSSLPTQQYKRQPQHEQGQYPPSQMSWQQPQTHLPNEQHMAEQQQYRQQERNLAFQPQPSFAQPSYPKGDQHFESGSGGSCWEGAVVPNWNASHGRGTNPIHDRPWEDLSRERYDARNRVAMDVAEMDRSERIARKGRSSVRIGAPPGGRSQISFG